MADCELTDTGFNTGSLALLPWGSTSHSRWIQENGSLVVGPQPGPVAPQEGDGMLKIQCTAPFGLSRVRQRIDISARTAQIVCGGVTASAMGYVNAPIAGVIGGVEVTALDVSELSVGSASGTFGLDPLTTTWQLSTASLVLPVTTRYIELTFVFTNASLGTASAYGDGACIVFSSGFPNSCNGDGGDQVNCTPCPCSNNMPPGTCGGCMNSVGTGALLSASGIPSLIPDTLQFNLTGAKPLSFAILFSGTDLLPLLGPCLGLNSGIQSSPFDGLRCVGTAFMRHGTRATDSGGESTSTWGPDLIADDSLPVGTRHFQVAYRDSVWGTCLTGLNTTQAVSVTIF